MVPFTQETVFPIAISCSYETSFVIVVVAQQRGRANPVYYCSYLDRTSCMDPWVDLLACGPLVGELVLQGLGPRRLGRDCYLSFHNPGNCRTLFRALVNAPAFFPTLDSYWALVGQSPYHIVHSRVDSGPAAVCFSDNASLAGVGLYPFCQKT